MGTLGHFKELSTCPNLPSIAVITIRTYLDTCTHHSLSFRETKAGTQGVQEPGVWEEQRPCWALFSALMPLCCSACFVKKEMQCHLSGMALSTVGSALQDQQLIKDLPSGQTDRGIFVDEIPCF